MLFRYLQEYGLLRVYLLDIEFEFGLFGSIPIESQHVTSGFDVSLGVGTLVHLYITAAVGCISVLVEGDPCWTPHFEGFEVDLDDLVGVFSLNSIFAVPIWRRILFRIPGAGYRLLFIFCNLRGSTLASTIGESQNAARPRVCAVADERSVDVQARGDGVGGAGSHSAAELQRRGGLVGSVEVDGVAGAQDQVNSVHLHVQFSCPVRAVWPEGAVRVFGVVGVRVAGSVPFHESGDVAHAW